MQVNKPPIINNYTIIKKIGHGSFGLIYSGFNNKTGEKIAIKCENINEPSTLKHEANILKYLSGMGIPKLRWYITDSNNRIMIMDLLGSSLEKLNRKYNFTQGDVYYIAMDILRRIKYIHNKGIIHRDIKPANFLICTNKVIKTDKKKESLIYLIDFGLSKYYKKDNTHMEYKTGKSFIGTLRYTSNNVHDGIEASRRDDLISIGYMLIYFLQKKLPWQDLNISNNELLKEKIGNIKKQLSVEDLCKDIPSEIYTYLDYCYKLNFAERPDYDTLINLFNPYLSSLKKFKVSWLR